MRTSRDFWVSCGHHLLDRDAAGKLLVTDEFLKAYLARPELMPPDACAAEQSLHSALLSDPRRPVAASQVAAIVDADARENWEIMIAWRDHLVKHRSLEAAYLEIIKRGIRFSMLQPRSPLIGLSAAAMPSLRELHVMAGVNNLPVQEIDDQSLVYPTAAKRWKRRPALTRRSGFAALAISIAGMAFDVRSLPFREIPAQFQANPLIALGLEAVKPIPSERRGC